MLGQSLVLQRRNLRRDRKWEVVDQGSVAGVDGEVEADGHDDEDDHERALGDADVLLLVVLSEEEETSEADLLDVEADKDVLECLGVEESSGLGSGRGVDDEEEEVLRGRGSVSDVPAGAFT